MKKIAYLGPKNSYSYLASTKVAGQGDTLIDCPTFFDVFEKVFSGAADIAVVPIENSSEGNISEVTDTLAFSDTPLFINRELVLKIENFLIGYAATKLEEIETIFTHWQPYAQCRQNLKKLVPQAKIVFAGSTAAAVKEIDGASSAALGGRQLVKGEHIILSDGSVNDNDDNRTRFVVVSQKDVRCHDNKKFTVVFEAENKPGGLLKLLEIINAFGMNMTRIESRPQKTTLGRYIFIVDIGGNILDDDTAEALALLKRNTVFFKYLGGYN